MLVPAARMAEAIEAAAKAAADSVTVGDPQRQLRHRARWSPRRSANKIQELIQKGMDEGAELVTGGPGRPEGLDKGYYVKPTVFATSPTT